MTTDTQPSRRYSVRRAALALAITASSAAAAGAALTLSSTAAHASTAGPMTVSYTFKTLDNPKDKTFNQLLDINDHNLVAGYYGNGMSAAHPNKGYLLEPPDTTSYLSENFPGSVQTQVTGVNNSSTTSGFYADAAGDNYGFVYRQGVWWVSIDPSTTGNVNQLLGLNNYGVAVGFYTDKVGNAHAYEFNFHADTFSNINIPNATASTATAINMNGDVSGFYTVGKTTAGFLLKGGKLTTIEYPGSTNTQVLGINGLDQVVGSYMIGSATHGFIWQNGQFRSLDDPSGVGNTVINGLNDNGDLVGFYTQGSIVHGFLATP